MRILYKMCLFMVLLVVFKFVRNECSLKFRLFDNRRGFLCLVLIVICFSVDCGVFFSWDLYLIS